MNIPGSPSVIGKNARVLVTGATGFVGAYVVRDLVAQGYRVIAIRRKQVTPQFIDPGILSQVQWMEGDVLDVFGLAEIMREADAVIHSAAKVSFHSAHRSELFKTNIEGTENVVNAAIESNIKRLLYVSSVAAIGRKNNGTLVNEMAEWQTNKWTTAYAVSKHHAEMHVWRGIAEGLNAVIVNPTTIVGYGDWNASSTAIFRNVYDGFKWYSTGSTGFVDVEDVSEAITRLMTTNIHSERFILNGENWTYRKLLETIADGFNKKRPTMKASPFLSQIAWRLEKMKSVVTGKNPLISRETARIAQSSTFYDNSKILSALPGFHFRDLEKSIAAACAKYINKPYQL